MYTTIAIKYTLNGKKRAYSEEIRKNAIKTYYSGVSGRGVGKLFGFSKSNVYNWIKKTEVIVENSPDIFELDELYWFINRKPRTETRENVYLMTMVSRNPRQIAGFDVALDKSTNHIQNMVDHMHPMLKSTVLMDTSVIWMLFSRDGISEIYTIRVIHLPSRA